MGKQLTPTSPKNNLLFPTGNFACVDAAEVDSLQEPFLTETPILKHSSHFIITTEEEKRKNES